MRKRNKEKRRIRKKGQKGQTNAGFPRGEGVGKNHTNHPLFSPFNVAGILNPNYSGQRRKGHNEEAADLHPIQLVDKEEEKESGTNRKNRGRNITEPAPASTCSKPHMLHSLFLKKATSSK